MVDSTLTKNMQNLPMKIPNKKGILVLTPTLLKYMSLSLNKFKLGFCSDTYLPFGPKSRFLLFFFFDVVPKGRVQKKWKILLHRGGQWGSFSTSIFCYFAPNGLKINSHITFFHGSWLHRHILSWQNHVKANIACGHNYMCCINQWIFLVLRSRRLRDSRSHNVCMSVCMSQTLIRFKSMNSSVNSFPEWQKLLDIDESD